MSGGGVGLLHPGQMGAALAAVLTASGHTVWWASAGRSAESAARAAAAGAEDAGSVEALAARSEVILSVCPPHGAVEVAASVAASGFSGLYVDANAISPATAREVAAAVEAAGARFVDGGIIGPPPTKAGTTRLYLSGPDAVAVTELWTSPMVETQVVGDQPTSASALKLAFSSWSKGSAALLIAAYAAAEAEDVGAWLLEEWRTSTPGLGERLAAARRDGEAKGWRWVGEMEEIAAMFASDGLPDGFHQAAAEIWRRAADGRQ